MGGAILIVEDEPAIAETLQYALQTEGFEPHWAALAQDALARLREREFALAILDVGLPDMHGFDLCRRMREVSDLPVVFLTARGEEIDRVVGLEIGADDYITKPFSPREVVARVRVILRRMARAAAPPAAEPSGLVVDEDRASAHFNGRELLLTRYEFLLLKTLAARPRQVFSRQQLMDAVWVAPGYSGERTVDTHVKTLRAKLREADPRADPIRTHRGLGYSFEPKPAGAD